MQIIQEGLISLYSFYAAAILPFCIFPGISNLIKLSKLEVCCCSIILSYALVNAVFFIFTKKHLMKVIIRASFLGVIFSGGIYVSVYGIQHWPIFGWYMCVLSMFHYSEYLCIAITNPRTLTTDSFMLNHSVAYAAAATASWIEFVAEHHLIPGLKNNLFISVIGLVLCIMGEILRKSAMLTASTNFNHIVQTVKERDHELVTHGVYSICRHPSYVGWFYWSIGTQLILVNPICVIIYAIASWTFFKTRVKIEEEALLNFFGDQYMEYKKHVYSGLPFNNGVSLKE